MDNCVRCHKQVNPLWDVECYDTGECLCVDHQDDRREALYLADRIHIASFRNAMARAETDEMRGLIRKHFNMEEAHV